MLKVFASQVSKVFYVHKTTQPSDDIPREMNDAVIDLSVKANSFAINAIRTIRRTSGRQAVFFNDTYGVHRATVRLVSIK
jgi:hypothetical protein